MAVVGPAWGALGLLALFALISPSARIGVLSRPDKETRDKFYGNLVMESHNSSGEGSIADIFDRVLEKEFSDNDSPEGADQSSFNNTVADHQVASKEAKEPAKEEPKFKGSLERNILE